MNLDQIAKLMILYASFVSLRSPLFPIQLANKSAHLMASLLHSIGILIACLIHCFGSIRASVLGCSRTEVRSRAFDAHYKGRFFCFSLQSAASHPFLLFYRVDIFQVLISKTC